jgi:hypothetical protein
MGPHPPVLIDGHAMERANQTSSGSRQCFGLNGDGSRRARLARHDGTLLAHRHGSEAPGRDHLSGTDFELGVAQNWAQYFISEKLDEAKSLKISGEPGRTRTCNPLFSTDLLCS